MPPGASRLGVSTATVQHACHELSALIDHQACRTLSSVTQSECAFLFAFGGLVVPPEFGRGGGWIRTLCGL